MTELLDFKQLLIYVLSSAAIWQLIRHLFTLIFNQVKVRAEARKLDSETKTFQFSQTKDIFTMSSDLNAALANELERLNTENRKIRDDLAEMTLKYTEITDKYNKALVRIDSLQLHVDALEKQLNGQS